MSGRQCQAFFCWTYQFVSPGHSHRPPLGSNQGLFCQGLFHPPYLLDPNPMLPSSLPRPVGAGHPFLPWDLSPCFWDWGGGRMSCAYMSTHSCSHPLSPLLGAPAICQAGAPRTRKTQVLPSLFRAFPFLPQPTLRPGLCPGGCPAWAAPTGSLTLWPPVGFGQQKDQAGGRGQKEAGISQGVRAACSRCLCA